MAKLLWGKVYYQTHFAGILRQEPGDRVCFVYDSSYLSSSKPAIAYTLPLQVEPHVSEVGLPAFFDNLVAEGWLEQAQTRLLGKRSISRFELLLAFGYDCAGAVSVIDPEPAALSELLLDENDTKAMAVLTSRASLSGVQPKLALVVRDGYYCSASVGEVSTHIAKFPSANHSELIFNEYLTTLAFCILLPEEEVVKLSIDNVKGQSEQALIIERFDRDVEQGRLHFEEFNQLLARPSSMKYEGAHSEMADFIRQNRQCLPVENYRLFSRIIVGFLLGNTDMHFKNFAMRYTEQGLRLAPVYDQVAAVIYQYKNIALQIAGTAHMPLGKLEAKHVLALSEEFSLKPAAVNMLIKRLVERKEAAKQAIFEASVGSTQLKQALIDNLEKRWNGTFALIGEGLSKKR